VVLAAGLPDERSTDDRAVRIDEESFRQLLVWAVQQRLTGLLCEALQQGSLVVEAGCADELVEQAHDAHRSALHHALAAEATAVTISSLLAAMGIAAYAFKGIANAHLDYPDPAWRTFFDTDVYVARQQFGEAIGVLLDAGYTRTSVPLGARWERRFARACELRSPGGIEVDLHAAVATGYFGTVLDDRSLRADPDSIALAGDTVTAFSLPARALISCYSIVLSRGPGLRLQRDLAQQLVALDGRWREVVDLAGTDGHIVIAESLRTVATTFPGVGPSPEILEWASGVRPTELARRALVFADRGEKVGWSADARSAMLALGPIDTTRFGIGIAWGRRPRRRARNGGAARHVTA
jgi:hypothetical protein